MPILNLSIGKSRYTVNCMEGEEEKILTLGKKLNERVNNLSSTIKNADEKTILMLCALMLEEELQTVKKDVPAAENYHRITGEDLEDAVITQIEETTDYIVNLTKKITAF